MYITTLKLLVAKLIIFKQQVRLNLEKRYMILTMQSPVFFAAPHVCATGNSSYQLHKPEVLGEFQISYIIQYLICI
jgi:hypothetical protein